MNNSVHSIRLLLRWIGTLSQEAILSFTFLSFTVQIFKRMLLIYLFLYRFYWPFKNISHMWIQSFSKGGPKLELQRNKRAIMALGRSPEYHWNQIISKSVHRFSRRSRLKLFSIYSHGGHFVQQSRTV